MRTFLLLIAVCLSLSSANAQTSRRVALVIGNQNYVVGPAQLARPHADARLVHQALVSAGFDAGEAPLFDLEKPAFENALRDFARQARHAEAAVVYYAGHAIHALNETWLIPVGARLELQDDIRTEGIRLGDVVAIARRDGLSIVFLDACRDNPFASYRNLSGLPVTPPPEGSVVAYAAAAGHPAPDDGAYAAALAARMQEEGVELRQFLNRVAADVRRMRNVPAELSPVAEIQLANTNHFYFRGGPIAAASTPTPTVLTYTPPDQAPDARQTAADVRAPLVRSEDVSRLRDFALFRECEFCPEMVVLPAGSFLMGSPQSETGRSDDEDDRSGPGGEQVRVNVQRFAIGRFEVTGDEWTACRGCAQTIGGRGRYPATTMSWNDAQVYVRWMNEVAGGLAAMGVVYSDDVGPYRLPSEAEWEFAARSGSTARFWWGDEGPACDQDAGNGANYEECVVRTARPVGSFRANDFGLFDMHGNVWEWVSDCTSTAYASISNNGAASFLEPCEFRQNRGGSWDDSHVNLRSANRSGYVETYQSNYLGVRVARIV